MSHRQLADPDGHRWDVEDEGPLNPGDGPWAAASHQLRFRRDDGAEHVRTAPRALDRMADVELQRLLREADD